MIIWEDWLIPWLHPHPVRQLPAALAYIDRYGPTAGCSQQSLETEET